jgi:hypothetical protein
MASWERGAGFRVCGAVTREPFCRDTFGRVTIAVPGKRGETKIDLVTFDAGVIAEMRGLGVGMTVQVTGSIEMEAVKDRTKEKVLVDGYPKWVPLLVAKRIDVEGSSRKPAEKLDVNDAASVKGAW